MSYLTLRQAACAYGCTYCALWRGAKRKSLKTLRINDVLYTTHEWVQEYKKNWKNKEAVSRFNGIKVFDDERGEYSALKAAKILNLTRAQIYCRIYSGHIEAIRKGIFYVITNESIEKYINTVESEMNEIAN